MQRNMSVDILKLIMAFLIVGLHGQIFSEVNQFVLYLFKGVCRIGVPVFLLISGFYFYKVTDDKGAYRWVKRICILYVIWFFAYAYFWLPDSEGNMMMILKNFLLGYFHLWYLIHSAAAFVMMYLLKDRPKILFALFLICSFCGLFIQYAQSYGLDAFGFSFGNLGSWYYRNAIFFCFPFIYIGYNINKYQIQNKLRGLPTLLILGFALLILEICLNYKFSQSHFDILLSLYFIAPLLLIFALGKKIYSNNKTLSLYATGVYLIHPIFLKLPIREFLGFSATPYVIFVFVISLLTTWPLVQLNKKIKYIL